MKFVAVALLALLSFRGDLKLGEAVPDLTIKLSDDKEIKLSDFKADKEKKTEGKVVVIFFQSEKCPSRVKPEAANKIAAAYADEKSNVKFISIFAYPHDTAEGIKAFCEANKVANAWTFDGEKKIKEHFGAKQVNTTYVIDRDGKLTYRGGFTSKDENLVEAAVKAALEGTKAPESDRKFAG